MILSAISEYISSLSFRGNSKLRPAGSEIEYSQEMIDEFILCKKDPIYFVKNYVCIIHPTKGIVKFNLYDYQEDLINLYHAKNRVITLQPRQSGKSISTAAYLLWYSLFNDNKTIAVLANKQATADEILGRIRLAFEELPKFLQQGVRTWNKRSIELENGSKIFSSASSASSIRGRSISILYLDELGFIPNNQAEEFFTAVYPTISAGKDSKILISSTPNGYNMFQKFWNDAEKDINGFTPVRVYWNQTPGRNQQWYDDQKAVLGELKAAQELDCEFLGSSKTLFTGATLSRLSYDTPIKEYDGEFKGLKIYKLPEKDKVYVATVDTSRGRHLDSSAFTVFDITQYPHTIAATYRNNEIAPLMYASVVEKIARNYNRSYLLIEINDIGGQIADTIYSTLEYDGDMFWTKSGDQLGKEGADPYPGVRTTVKTKRIGCANLKDMVENNQLIINDFEMISELSTFIQKDNGKYEADIGFHDDTVTTLWLHAWLVTQPFFAELTDQNMRLAMHGKHIEEMEDALMMTSYFDDGTDYHEHPQNYDKNDDSWDNSFGVF